MKWWAARRVIPGVMLGVMLGGLGGGTGQAARVPVAVLWTEGAGEAVGEAPPAEAVAQVESALASGRGTRPLEDAEVKRLLIEGGPKTRVGRLLGEARRHFATQRLAEADAALARAEETALRELPVAEISKPLGEIESLRLLCAELLRSDAAAERAARLLLILRFDTTPEVRAAIERHRAPFGPELPAPPVRVETDPPGATVYVDLRPVGPAPLDLPSDRHPDALIDIEAPGYAKIHRQGLGAGTLAVALRHDSGLGAKVDALRAVAEMPEPDVAALGRAVGAERVLVVRLRREPGTGVAALEARALDVSSAKWARSAFSVALAPGSSNLGPVSRLAEYAASGASAKVSVGLFDASERPVAISGATQPQRRAAPPPPSPPKTQAKEGAKRTSPWKKWYTWVLAGGLGGAVVGVVVANRVGDDQVTIRVTR